jgi:hypothetical protein
MIVNMRNHLSNPPTSIQQDKSPDEALSAAAHARKAARHLELVMAKCQASELLVKMRLVGEAMKRTAGALPIPPPPGSLSVLPAPESAPDIPHTVSVGAVQNEDGG